MNKIAQILRKSLVCLSFAAVLLGVANAQALTDQPKEEHLLNGLKLLMWSDASAPLVNVKIRIHSGSAFDPQGKEGVMKMLSENIFPNEATHEFFKDDLGGSFEIISTYDRIEIDASATPDNLLQMLETLGSAVTNVQVDKETTAKLKAVLTAQIAAAEKDGAYRADQAIAARLFGTFPYGRPQIGTAESVAKIDFADLIDARLRFLTSDNATVAVSGNIDKAIVFRAVRRYFGSWLKSDKRVPSQFKQPEAPVSTLQTIKDNSSSESFIRFAMRGVARNDKNFAASNVYALILEDRLKSRVPAAFSSEVTVRDEDHVLPGSFVVRFSAGKGIVGENNGKVEVTDLMLKALNDPVTDAEFQKAKSAFVATWEKRDVPSLWLDVDTFKTTGVASELSSIRNVSLADVKTYAEMLAKAPAASVLIVPAAK